MDTDVVVIGAGAAGMMCAAEAGRRGRRVLLIDHWPKIGERIRFSGGGRCNFTNRLAGADAYLSQNPAFCRSALARFSARDFIAMVERSRIPYHERSHGQLFCDRSAQDIIGLLRCACDDSGVRLAAPCMVRRVESTHSASDRRDGRFVVATDQGTFSCESVVVATGGLAVPKLGASALGYEIAEQFGVPVIPPAPALVPLTLAPQTEEALRPLAGISLDAEARCGTAQQARFRESVLITHRGLSGPAILQISSYWQMQAWRPGEARTIEIDLLPEIDALAWLAAHRHRRVLPANLLACRLPRRFAQEWCRIEGFGTPLSECSTHVIEGLARALKGWSLTPAGSLGYAKAEVTLGGIDTRALSSKTMEVRAVPGLFFIGEVVDVTGWLGGYNFQWAWSSGWVAGQFA
jgi:hypothetical protein